MDNKTILITGSTSGLGREITKLLVKDNKVIILGRNEELLTRFKKELESSNVDYFVCDFNNLDQVKKVSNAILSKYNKIDIIINNAGALPKANGNLIHPSLTINFLSPMLLNDLLKPLLLKSNDPLIYYTSTMALPKDISDVKLLNMSNCSKIKAYSNSKLAFNIYLANLIRDTNIKIKIFDPRIIYTNTIKTMIPKVFRFITPIAHLFSRQPKKVAIIAVEVIKKPNNKKINHYKLNKEITPTKLISYYENHDNVIFLGKKLIKNYFID